MLACPVIKRNSQLTDRLLRLLSLISLGQPDVLKRLDDPARTEDSSEQSVLVDRMIRDEQIQLAVEVLTSTERYGLVGRLCVRLIAHILKKQKDM